MANVHNEILYLLPPVETLVARIRYASYKESTYPHSSIILFVMSNFHFFFSGTVTFWNRLPRECFTGHYILSLFKYRAKP